MRINPDFILREVAGEVIAIPTGEAARNFSGLIAFNNSGRFLCELLKNDCTVSDLITAMLEAYDVDEATAKRDVLSFLEMLRSNSMLIESNI